MVNPFQDIQMQDKISNLYMEIDKLRHDLETQKALSNIMISSLVAALNEMSEKRNVYEILTSVIENFKLTVNGKNKSVDEALTEAVKMLKNESPRV